MCGASGVADGQWHHVAATRRDSDGRLQVFVDGALQVTGFGPTGNISYRDGRPTSWPGSDPFLVFGAEKHDAGPSYPSYSGWLDEVRLSTVIRYSSTFTPSRVPFTTDAGTAALYHLDEAAGDLVADSSGAPGGPSHGQRRFGGNPAGPEWSAETPLQQLGAFVTLVQRASSLSAPVGVTHAGDGSGRLFIIEQPGRIRILPNVIQVMEVCGTHTVALFRHGIRSFLPKNLKLLSGPGCPVCVTDQGIYRYGDHIGTKIGLYYCHIRRYDSRAR